MKRCLFIDDSGLIRKVAKRILTGADMMVIEAETAEEALNVCALDMPDIIVVDSLLPGIEAPDFIRRVRAMPAAVKPQILVCLVEVDVAAIMRAKRAGAQGYLLKPFDRGQILQSLASASAAA